MTFEHIGGRSPNIEQKTIYPVPILSLNVHESGAADVRRQSDSALHERLSQALREWYSRETADWDALVEAGSDTDSDATDSDLWGSMPAVDSKAVARTSPIFEKHLGRPLDVQLIRPGGYDSVGNMIRHLVPAMMEVSQARGGVRAVEQEVEP